MAEIRADQLLAEIYGPAPAGSSLRADQLLAEFYGVAYGGNMQQPPQTINAIGGMPYPPVPLQTIIPSYLYEQYSDDENLVAFVAAYNALAQSYLDWFNASPLAVYTQSNISGQLLDWIGLGIYGIPRPVFSELVTRFLAGVNANPLNTVAVNGSQYFQRGAAIEATDDFYKRVLTWWLYFGDGRYFDISLLRKKVARFLYGVDGTDINLSQTETVHITVGSLASPPAPSLSSVLGGALPATHYSVRESYLSPVGETLAGPASGLSVAANHLLIAQSPPPEVGAVSYNLYLSKLAGNILAGVNALPVNAAAVNGFSAPGNIGFARQNASPIAIGTAWDEPPFGWIPGPPLPSSNTTNPDTNFIISVPPGLASQRFKQALDQNILSFPFQFTASVIIES